MKSDPEISIIMSVYNTPDRYLKEAIESILNQTFSDFEFIIIDDSSTTDIKSIICEYEDNRIIFLQNRENKGLAWSLNKCIRVSKGRYIARMDSDDVSLPQRLEKQIKYMENTNTDVLSTHVRYIGALSGESRGKWDSESIKANLFFENKPIVHPTVMIRRDFLIKNSVEYNEDYKKAQDYELWTKVIDFARFGFLDDVLLLYRVHPNQASIKGGKEQNNYADQVRLNLLEAVFPNIEFDILSHNQLCRLDVTEDIHSLCKWCSLLLLNNRDSKFFKEAFFEEIVIKRLIIVYLKTLKRNEKKIIFLVKTLLNEKILLNIFKPKFPIKLLQEYLRRPRQN